MVKENRMSVGINTTWIFVPLGRDDALRIYYWIKRRPLTEEADKELAAECEQAIASAFDQLGLIYNTHVFGETKMENLRLFASSDGISLPETCFIDVSDNIKRIQNPLRPLQENS